MADVSLSRRLIDDVHGLAAHELQQLYVITEHTIRSLIDARSHMESLRASGAGGLGDLIDEIAATIHDDLSPLLDASEGAYDRQTAREAVSQRQAFSSRRERVL